MVRIDPGNTAFTPLAFDYYPWSHSLSMAFVWAVAVGRVAAAVLRHARAGLIIGLTVLSHWVLDFFMHRPDLPLWPGGPEVGLGLWNSIPLTLLVEGVLFAAGVAIYLRATRARDRVGTWAFWAPRPADDGDLDQRAVVPAAAGRHGDRGGGTGALAVSRVGGMDRAAPREAAAGGGQPAARRTAGPPRHLTEPAIAFPFPGARRRSGRRSDRRSSRRCRPSRRNPWSASLRRSAPSSDPPPSALPRGRGR